MTPAGRSDGIRRLATAALCAAAVLPVGQPAAAQTDVAARPSLNFYGTTGLIDTPTAQSQPDGELSVTVSHFAGITRNTLTFQITPRLSGSFRYAVTRNWNSDGFATYYDRSFDLRYQLLDEGPWWPAVAVGLQDFVGTGIYAGEYVVATRSFGDSLSVTGGIGWGRLGSYNSFGAPFSDTRPVFDPGSTGGQIAYDQWFRGPAALFGGVEWRPTDRLGVMVEYSPDAYLPETGRGVFTRESPWNVGVEFQASEALRLGAYYMFGTDVGITAQLSFNPRRPPTPGLAQAAPVPIAPRPDRATAPGLYETGWASDPSAAPGYRAELAARLQAEGQILRGFNLWPDSAELRVENTRYDAAAQAIGRTARVMAAVLPASVETFRITLMDRGLALSTTVLHRSDLEALEPAPDSAEALRRAAATTDAGPTAPGDEVAVLYPRLDWSGTPYVRSGFFDPENPVLLDLGVRLRGTFEFAPGWSLSGSVAQRLAGNMDRARTSPSLLPAVRTSGPLYEGVDTPVLETLTLEHARSLGPDLYGRVTLGYLERMYAGASAEILWAPAAGPLALGAEVNYAVQRDFDMQLGLRDLDAVTGFASAYYSFGDGFFGQLDMGRYLAGDWGATLTLEREFCNGWRVGAFATVTDASAEEFGEGSFDKGITLSIPLSWFTRQPSRTALSTTIRPVTRDGGARLDVPGRLYDRVRTGSAGEINDQWARVWR